MSLIYILTFASQMPVVRNHMQFLTDQYFRKYHALGIWDLETNVSNVYCFYIFLIDLVETLP
jgi:hypothetical protein